MKINRIIINGMLLMFGCLGSGLASAGNMGVLGTSSSWDWVLTFGIGPAWTTPGQTQSLALTSTLSQLYVPHLETETILSGEIDLSLQHPISHHILGQLGFGVTDTSSIPLNGEIWQDNDPDFNNFNYNYKVNHTHVVLRGKLLMVDLMEQYPSIQPYVSASIGLGWNHAYHYADVSTLVEVAPEPGFQTNTSTAFTYTLDAGIQKQLNRHWALGVGYEFADWGKSQLGAAPGQVGDSGLQLNHTYINQLVISVSLIIA